MSEQKELTVLNKEQKYAKLLNNLLGISIHENSLFFKVNGVDSFDMTTKFGEFYSKKIIDQKEFVLNLTERDLAALQKEVKKATTAQAIMIAYEKYKINLVKTKIAALKVSKTFSVTKNKLIAELDEEMLKIKNRWLRFRRKVLDANIQENIWQLHLATCFISIKTLKKEVYCPLILREVSLNVENDKVEIASQGSWKINEKALFILRENQIVIDESLLNYEEMTANELISVIAKQLNLVPNFDEITKGFVNLDQDAIIDPEIKLHSGVVLGMFKPSGWYIRKTMLKIIQDDEIDKILDAEADKNIYKKKVHKFLQNEKNQILKIQRSNFSQDKAIASSLIQDTIIWGPPGTGKSQVIANIIANIFFKNKTAVVMSQKKAALDVLKKRLGKLAPFTLFILNDNKMNKTEFYKPLQKFVDLVENVKLKEEQNSNTIISKKVVESLNNIWESKTNKSYEASLKLVKIFKEKSLTLRKIFNLKSYLIYPNDILPLKDYVKEIAKMNKIKVRNLGFMKYYPDNLKEQSELALEILKEMKVDLNIVSQLASQTNYKTVCELMDSVEILNYERKYQSDEKFLVNILAARSIQTIGHWKKSSRYYYNEYKKFANAVRAGRRLPYKFLDDHQEVIKKLFPIIITTPETTFINWEKKYFDYAILDESSQVFLEVGLPILYIAKTRILAGDPQQMQPSRWFVSRDEGNVLEDIPENAESVLDYAFDKGVYQNILNQNFRSSTAALMSFSAKKFYNSKLDVVDKKRRHVKEEESSIIVKNVAGKWENGVNEVEADEVLKIVNREINNYKNIIILAFNSGQRELIEKKIIENETSLYNYLEAETLSIRNIENIQGDEADLVIMSVVYDNTTNIASTYVAKPKMGKNALNVAITRAKDKIIVVKSIKARDVKASLENDSGVFREWLEFIDKSEAEKKTFSNSQKSSTKENILPSAFTKDVISELETSVLKVNPYKIVQQFPVGSKDIDLALVDQDGKYVMGIEVDNYTYDDSKEVDNYLENLSRQDFLESKGYNIFRIKEVDWQINRMNIIKDLNNLLDTTK